MSWIYNQIRWHVCPLLRRLRRTASEKRLRSHISGRNNRVECPASTGVSSVTINGDDNSVAVSTEAMVGSLAVNISGKGNRLEVLKEARLESLSIWFQGDGSKCVIGEAAYISGAYLILAESGTQIEIGPGCMIAQGVEMRTGDSHGIFDLSTRERINPGNNIRIGSKVWLANGVLVLKGAVIPDGCVVGARSVVTKALEEENAAYAGTPAKRIRSGIVWSWHLDRLR